MGDTEAFSPTTMLQIIINDYDEFYSLASPIIFDSIFCKERASDRKHGS